MYFATLPLWIFAAILYFSDRKNRSNLWLSTAAFFAGLGGVSVFLLEYVIPYIQINFTNNAVLLYILNIFICLFSLSCLLLYPYCLLLFSLNFSDILQKYVFLKRALKFVSLIPLIFILTITPYTHYSSPDTVPPFIDFIVFWALFCFLPANFLLVYSFFKSKTSIEKTQRLLVCILVTPSSLASFFTTYASHWIGRNIWRYNSLLAILILMIFILFAATYGILGLKLKTDLKKLDNRIKSTSLGTSAINHAIKNELQNISICNQAVKKLLQDTEDQKLSDDIGSKLDIMQNSVGRLMSITSKINEQIKDLILDETVCVLEELIDFSIDNVKALAQSRNVNIIKNVNFAVEILCDRSHMQEVLINILKNAIDAIKDHGNIQITVLKFRKHISVAITDDGSGIPKDKLRYVFEPFFSTKSSNQNFGIGLAYCFNVMRKHGSTIEIQSEEGKGTSVILNFSPKKIIRISDEFSLEERLQANMNETVNSTK